jgi:hypothetical protein
MREPRLGDDIDDFCVRCKRIMNHAVVSVIDAQPAKVRCRTCHSDHDFRHEQAPPPKVDLRKQALFNEVLKKVDPTAEAAGASDDPTDLAVTDLAAELGAVLDSESVPELDLAEEAADRDHAEVAMGAEAGAEALVAKPAPKGKAKAKGRARR